MAWNCWTAAGAPAGRADMGSVHPEWGSWTSILYLAFLSNSLSWTLLHRQIHRIILQRSTADSATFTNVLSGQVLTIPAVLLQQTPFGRHLCKLGADYSIERRVAELENNMIPGCLRCLVLQTPVHQELQTESWEWEGWLRS